MKRNIIHINEELCNGCGQCVAACHEGALQLVNGKAKLVSEVYCDGLGDCIGECPTGALTIEKRESDPFDKAATTEHVQHLEKKQQEDKLPCGCPGTMARRIERPDTPDSSDVGRPPLRSELTNWPVQLKLVPPGAPYLKGADLLLAADCVPFAMADFHGRFLKGKPVLVGCPKLDDADAYVEKLAAILKEGGVRSLTVLHMEVPCCSGLTRIAEAAIEKAGADVPCSDITVSIQGDVIDG